MSDLAINSVIYINPSSKPVFQAQEECMIYLIMEQKCNFVVSWLRQTSFMMELHPSSWNE